MKKINVVFKKLGFVAAMLLSNLIFSQNETGSWSVPINQIKAKIEEEISHE
jgi:hypothetical protein